MKLLNIYSKGWYSYAVIIFICIISFLQAAYSIDIRAHFPEPIRFVISEIGTFCVFFVAGIALSGLIRLIGKFFGHRFMRISFHIFMLPLFFASVLLIVMNSFAVYFGLTIGLNALLFGFRFMFIQKYAEVK
jgi:hypothetical protein